MTYVLTLWLVIGGQWLELREPVPAEQDCRFVAEAMAKERGAEFAALVSCVLEIGV
jgi:hypothetical protein